MQDRKIKVKAMCLLIHDQRVLVADGETFKSDSRLVVPGNFYRVLGGSIDFNETSEQAVRREIQEELGSEINNLEKLDVIEHIFIYAGNKNMKSLFYLKGRLLEKN